jgi:hypothetical protein
MATCFDSIESSSSLPKNISNVSIFIVHSGIPNAMHYKYRYIGSVLWKAWWWLSRVETCCYKNILCNKLLCLAVIYTLYELDKHIGMTNVKKKPTLLVQWNPVYRALASTFFYCFA